MSSISLKSWLNMWARLCRGSAGMDDFPIWVQCLPKVLFNVIVAREESDVISKEALKTFYEKFGGLTGAELERTAEIGFNTATDVILSPAGIICYLSISPFLSSLNYSFNFL